MSIIDSLIYDRAQADRAALDALLAQANAGTITAEGWAVLQTPGHRGAYDYTHLNRVTEAMNNLHERLTGYGYNTGYVPLKIEGNRTEWQEGDAPTPEQLDAYLANLRALKSVLALLSTTPAAPADMEDLTINEANAIEKILADLDFQVVTMATTFIPCGEAICGGDNL